MTHRPQKGSDGVQPDLSQPLRDPDGTARPSETLYGIVGDGRVARHFAHYFNLRGIPFRRWSRRLAASTRASAGEALRECPVILLLVSDPAIDALGAELSAMLPRARFFHVAGSHFSPSVPGAHPLMTFGPDLYALAQYEAIPFVVDHAAHFKAAFPALPNPVFEIKPADKSRYHALCALAGNFTSFLWAKLFAEFPQLGLPAEIAVPFLKQVTANLAENPAEPARFFTGPVARGDTATVARHLAALAQDPYQNVYEAFVEAHARGNK